VFPPSRVGIGVAGGPNPQTSSLLAPQAVAGPAAVGFIGFLVDMVSGIVQDQEEREQNVRFVQTAGLTTKLNSWNMPRIRQPILSRNASRILSLCALRPHVSRTRVYSYTPSRSPCVRSFPDLLLTVTRVRL